MLDTALLAPLELRLHATRKDLGMTSYQIKQCVAFGLIVCVGEEDSDGKSGRPAKLYTLTLRGQQVTKGGEE